MLYEWAYHHRPLAALALVDGKSVGQRQFFIIVIVRNIMVAVLDIEHSVRDIRPILVSRDGRDDASVPIDNSGFRRLNKAIDRVLDEPWLVIVVFRMDYAVSHSETGWGCYLRTVYLLEIVGAHYNFHAPARPD